MVATACGGVLLVGADRGGSLCRRQQNGPLEPDQAEAVLGSRLDTASVPSKEVRRPRSDVHAIHNAHNSVFCSTAYQLAIKQARDWLGIARSASESDERVEELEEEEEEPVDEPKPMDVDGLEMLRDNKVPSNTTGYRGVRRNGIRFQAFLPGSQYLGTFATAEEAADCIAKRLQQSESPPHSPPLRPRHQLPPPPPPPPQRRPPPPKPQEPKKVLAAPQQQTMVSQGLSYCSNGCGRTFTHGPARAQHEKFCKLGGARPAPPARRIERAVPAKPLRIHKPPTQPRKLPVPSFRIVSAVAAVAAVEDGEDDTEVRARPRPSPAQKAGCPAPPPPLAGDGAD